MSLVLHTILLLALLYAGYRAVQRNTSSQKWFTKVFFGALLFKLGLTLASYYIHTTIYSDNDLTAYWVSAEEIASLAGESGSSYLDYLLWSKCEGDCPATNFTHQPRALLFARWLSIFYLFSGGSAWITSLWMSVISFSGAWYLFRKVSCRWTQIRTPAAIAFLFFPTPVFWSSGIQKETLAITFIYVISALLLPLLTGTPGRFWWLKLAVAGMLGHLLWMVKYYYAAVLVPVLLLTVVVVLLATVWPALRNSVRKQVFLWGMLLITGFLAGRDLHIAFSEEHFLPLLTRTHHEVVARSSEDAANHMPGLTADLVSFLLYTPEAAFTGFFRPLPGDGQGLLSWLVAIENSVLLLLTGLALYTLSRRAKLRWPLISIATFVYCAILAVFLAFAMPNYGSLMRYKAVFLPFYLLLILAICWPIDNYQRLRKSSQ